MNTVFLLFIFLFIRSSYATCRYQDFKVPLESNDCQCNDQSHSPMGRILNGTDLDRRDLLYVVAIYTEFKKYKTDKKGKLCQLHLLKDFFLNLYFIIKIESLIQH